MNANIGTVDRIGRIVAGLVLIGASVAGLIGAWGFIGVIPLVTGIVRFCPAYRLLGFTTCPRPAH
jgi:hypothetical protein